MTTITASRFTNSTASTNTTAPRSAVPSPLMPATSPSRRSARPLLWAAVLAAPIALTACSQGPAPMTAPQTLVAPYDTSRGEVLWAVAPLRNESGTTQADTLAISDRLVAAIEEARGLRALPVNRTIETMRALKMQGVSSAADAKKLAQALGADGLIVGSITSYDPYEPTFGLSLALFARPGAMQSAAKGPTLDVRGLTGRAAETSTPDPGSFQNSPLSIFTTQLDGKNHQVLLDVQAYAQGRHDPAGALNWKRYTASMDLYTQFAANYAVGGLLEQEWMRLARMGAAQERQEVR